MCMVAPLTWLFSGSHSHLGTDLLQAALAAARLSSQAGPATVMDQPMTEIDPLRPGNDGHEVLLNFGRILVGGQSQAVGQSLHVGIDDDARGNSKRGAKHDIRRLAAD